MVVTRKARVLSPSSPPPLNIRVVLLLFPVIHTVSTCLSVSDLVQSLVPHPTCLHHEEDRGRIEDHRAEDGQCERPTHVVVLPMRHPVASITPCTEDDDGYEAAGGGEEEQRSLCEQQNNVQVVVLGHDQEGAH